MASSNVVALKKTKTVTIGSLADSMFVLREKKRVLEVEVKDLSKQLEEAEKQMLELLDAQGTTKGDGKKASVSITEAVVPNVTDWDLFWAFVIKGKHTHLLQNRVSAPAWREMCELKKAPPGVVAFTKRTINLRNK